VKRDTVIQSLVLVSLIAAGALSRIYFRELPNFAPIAAMALFSGYFFRNAKVAVLAPLLAMSLSDLVIGAYQWQMMVLVYGMLALPVAFRGWLKKHLAIGRGSLRSTSLAMGGLLSCSLASSLLFFLVTNFGCWITMYERSPAGLLHCYQQALPFFANTLTGDLVFGGALFGSYALAINLGWAKEVTPSAVCESA
jgi:hypothetical protein